MSQNTSSAVMQWAEARALGLKSYFTGVPCPRGHTARRSVANRDCRACVDARRASNPEKRAAKNRRYYAETIEKRRSASRISRTKHVEKRRSYDQDRYRNNPERRERQKQQALRWARSNKGKRAAIVAARRAWIKLATPSWLTEEQKAEIRAFYLEAASREGEWHVDHIYPLRAKNSCGLHVPWNLQIITGDENRRKGNRFDVAE